MGTIQDDRVRQHLLLVIARPLPVVRQHKHDPGGHHVPLFAHSPRATRGDGETEAKDYFLH